jgi:hypothetical protein
VVAGGLARQRALRAAPDPETQKQFYENSAPDGPEDGLSRAELLLQAIDLGWRRKDFMPEDLL